MLATKQLTKPWSRLQAVACHYGRMSRGRQPNHQLARLYHRHNVTAHSQGQLIYTRRNQLSSRLIHARWLCSTKPPGDDPKDKKNNQIKVKIVGGKSASTTTNVPAQVMIPDFFPDVPCLTVSRSPVYPLFVKVIEVSHQIAKVFIAK